MNQLNVRQIHLPISVRGFVLDDPCGDYNVYINADLSYDVQHCTLIHEIGHIIKNHLFIYGDVEDLENEIE